MMQTKSEMIHEHNQLYHKMESQKNVEYMVIFGDTYKWLFEHLAGAHPDLADKVLSHLKAIDWNNYLSEHECMNIGKRIINEDGSHGFHWPYDVFLKKVKELGGETSEMPYYNCYALYVTSCMIYSDYARSIAEDLGYDDEKSVPVDKMALSCYKKAVEKLKDPDQKRFVRKYFKNKMYDDSPMM